MLSWLYFFKEVAITDVTSKLLTGEFFFEHASNNLSPKIKIQLFAQRTTLLLIIIYF